MNDLPIIAIVAIVGWLALALSEYRSENVQWKRAARHILIWSALFGIATLTFS